MKHHSRLVLLISLLAAFGMASCGNDSDSGNSETPPDCQLTQADCNSQDKTFDAANCICVDSGSSQGNCTLTEAMCASANKILDVANCICVDTGVTCPTECPDDCDAQGVCLVHNCGDIQDGQHTCHELKLMVCNNGTLEEATPGCNIHQICRNGESECSPYQDCGTIAHDTQGCLDKNIVACSDGVLTTITDCSAKDQLCSSDDKLGFICKFPEPTDCLWHETLIPQGQTICDGNVLKTCSATVDTEFDEGTDCAALDPATPICNPNACRAEKGCGNDGNIMPGDIVCNDDGTNKAECTDGNLVDLTGENACTARENATPVCTYSTEAVCSDTCNPGFTDVNGTCEKTKTCIDNKEIYLESTNTCACNTEAHYAGKPNACQCEPGYFERTDHCEAGCLYANAEYHYGDSTCSSEGKVLTCQPDGTMSEDTCEKGVCIGGKCEIQDCGDLHDGEYQCISSSLMMCSDGTLTTADTPCTSEQLCLDGAHACVDKKSCTATGTMLDTATNTCICNIAAHWEGTAGACKCATGYVEIDGACVEKRTCDESKEIYNSNTNTCSCNTDAHWTGTAGSCTCATGYVEIDGACVEKKNCDAVKETYDSTTNTCSCNPDAHWSGTAGSCTCSTGYVQVGNVCELKKSCDNTKEIYNSSTNTCSCNTASHWTGTWGSCTCATGYVEIGGACVEKKTCDTIKEIYNSSTNTCSCNTSAHWTGTAGSCTCATGYVEIGGACVEKKTCDAVKETYDSTANTCSCNSSAHWTGTAGSCTCATGYVEIGGVCVEKKTCDAVKETYDSTTNTCSCNSSAHWTGTAGSCTCAIGFYQDGNTCKPDDAEHCRGIDCTAVSYWGDGICTESGQCQVTSCIGDTHLYDDGTNTTCEANTASHCGDHITACGEGDDCVDGACTCEGLQRCDGACTNTQTDSDNCGTCGNACGNDHYCIEGSCISLPGIGSTITFGSYEQDDNTSNGKEPINWIVLDRESDGQLLVISEKVLDRQLYNTTKIDITWEMSTIRSWLNGYGSSYNTVGTSYTSNNFIDTAFTAEEKARIIASNVPAHSNPIDTSVSPGNATTDKIFLLSITEANNYFSSNSARQADATRYAVKQGVYVKGSESGSSTSNGTCTDVHCYAYWWLRSPGSNTSNAADVTSSGSVGSYGCYVSSGGRGVRPAMWVQY